MGWLRIESLICIGTLTIQWIITACSGDPESPRFSRKSVGLSYCRRFSSTPCHDDSPSLRERREPVLARAFVARLAVERFSVRILRCLVGCARQCGLPAINHFAVAPATAPHSQPRFTVQAVDALAIGVLYLCAPPERAVVKLTTSVRQLHQTHR